MASLYDLLESLPIDEIAQQLGEDPTTTKQAVEAALPALVGGMQANAQDPSGAESLVNALAGHTNPPQSAQDVDTADGEKIVSHVFGDNTDAVVNQLGGFGLSSGLISRLLPIIAPFVMGWLARNMFGRKNETAPAPAPQAPAPQAPSNSGSGMQLPGGINIQDILGDLLGQSTRQSQAPSGGGFGLDDLLGGLGGLLGQGRR